MVRFEINEKKYQTPEGWDKIKLWKFLEFLTKIEIQRPQALTSFMTNHYEAIGKIKDNLSDAAREYEAVQLFEKRWSRMAKLACRCHLSAVWKYPYDELVSNSRNAKR